MKNCLKCKKKFNPVNGNQKLCSRKCRNNKWNEKNPERKKQLNQEWNKENSEYLKEYHKKWKDKNPEKYKKIVNKASKKFKEKNPEKIKKWKDKNPKYYNNYVKERRKIDINFKLIGNLRTQFNHYMKLYSTTGKITSSKKYGLDWGEITKKMIEKRLLSYDKWDKLYPENPWTVDHIIPLDKCNHNNLEDIKKFYGINNLQWMKLKDNIKKGNRQ